MCTRLVPSGNDEATPAVEQSPRLRGQFHSPPVTKVVLAGQIKGVNHLGCGTCAGFDTLTSSGSEKLLVAPDMVR